MLIGIAGLILLGGCASVPTRVTTYKPPSPPQGMVIVVEGAGGNPVASRTVTAAVKWYRLPYYVRSIDWTHGPGLGVADMTDVEHSETEGQRLARQISDFRTRFPGMPIYIVAYSAGAQVALEATQRLEPDSLERIILLAPAVAADYDLRPALVAARRGVDAFTSERDGFYLGLATTIVGTADGEFGVPAAGRVGFDLPLAGPDLALAGRLHQHPWDRSMVWTGYNGEHSGTLRPAFFRAYVLPLLGEPIPVNSIRPAIANR